MTDFGSDINTPGGTDLDPWFATIAGPEAVAQACTRRLMTARGSLPDDPAYGYDVRVHLNDHAPNTAAIAAAVADQLERDERVRRATAAVTFDPAAGRLTITARVLLAEGPFALVLDVSGVSASYLLTPVS